MRALLRLLLTFCLLLTIARPAFATELPVISAGREAEIVALASPYFGDDKSISPGYAITNVDVEPHAIRFRVGGPNNAKGAILLEHSSIERPGVEHTASFAVTLDSGGDAAMAAALRSLLAAVRTNDRGTFWATAGPASAPAYEQPKQQGPSRFAKGEGTAIPWRDAPALLRDGVVLFLAAAVFLAMHLRRTLRSEPRRVTLALFGLVILGALLRLTLAREAPMNVWAYQRVVPLARAAFEGVTLRAVAAKWHLPIYLTDLNFQVTTVLAIVTPFAFFAHARFVLRDTRAALFAATLLVLLPMHIRFSRADSEFIQSLATSSLTFVVLYTALRDPSARWRAICFVLLPLLSVATYFVRPENLFFYLVDLGAIALTSGDEAPRRRKLIVFVELTAAAAFAFVAHLLAQYSSALSSGLSVRTLSSALSLFFHPRLNTLINPAITPPLVALLALLGGVFLYRRGERARALFLTCWLLGFFVVHSFVRPSEPAMQARYHMHLITPLLLLAASALPELARLPRRLAIAGAVCLVAAPFAHLPFERDVDFNEMNEFAFFRAVRPDIPVGCTLVEFSPAAGGGDAVLSSRLDRIGTRLTDQGIVHSFRVVNAGRMRGDKLGDQPYESLSDEVLELLKKPPPCLMVYEGLTCATHRPRGSERAPVCDALREKFNLQPVAWTSFGSRVYDEAIAGHMRIQPNGETFCDVQVKPDERINLMLSRATPRSQ